MDTNQIYSIVNSVVEQSLGNTTLTAVDATSLISLGNEVLSTQSNTEAFLNTLAQRIGRTIFSFRAYRNKLGDLVVNDFEWGAILQKIKVSMPTAEADQSFDLTDGAAVDHYVVSKPKANQKLFVTRTPYQYKITIQRYTLKEAFLSESAMGSFISQIFGEVQNAIELGLEDLGRVCIANMMAETSHAVNLVTNYNAATGNSVTADSAFYDEGFLRYSVAQMKQYSKAMTDMSTLYNDGSQTRHTPLADQRLFVNSFFETSLETQVQYAAFNEGFVSLNGFKEINFWQAGQSERSISVTRASDSTETAIDNIVAILFDRDALGLYKIEEDVLTTPVNAAGRYYNTFWHEQQLWFNDLSENFVMFTLN